MQEDGRLFAIQPNGNGKNNGCVGMWVFDRGRQRGGKAEMERGCRI